MTFFLCSWEIRSHLNNRKGSEASQFLAFVEYNQIQKPKLLAYMLALSRGGPACALRFCNHIERWVSRTGV